MVAPITLNNLVFSTVPSTGRYLAAIDSDGPLPTPLRINLTGPSPLVSGGFLLLSNGAIVNWPFP